MSERPWQPALEVAYWEFDARRKGYDEWNGHPQSERDAFKQVVSGLVESEVQRRVEEATRKDREEIENLLWNLAGCDTYASGWADPIEGHEKQLERPALAAVRRLVLRYKESMAAIRAEQDERTRLQAVINGFCAGLACKEPSSHDEAEVSAYTVTGKEVEEAVAAAWEEAIKAVCELCREGRHMKMEYTADGRWIHLIPGSWEYCDATPLRSRAKP